MDAAPANRSRIRTRTRISSSPRLLKRCSKNMRRSGRSSLSISVAAPKRRRETGQWWTSPLWNISDRLQGWDGKATTAHLWSVFARSNHAPNPLTPLIDGRHFTPDRYRDAPYTDYLLTSHPRTGGLRTYRIFHEFLFPTSLPPAAVSKGQVLRTLERLDAY